MIDHLGAHVSDVEVYRRLLAALGRVPDHDSPTLTQWGDLAMSPPNATHPLTTGLHLGLAAPDRAAVDAFHAAGLAAGATDDGAPGERDYAAGYYGAFLRDPDGNSVEAVHIPDGTADATLDHVWIRVADHDAAVPSYRLLARHAGLTERPLGPGRTLFGAGNQSVGIVADDRPVSRHVHLAWEASPDAIRAWHAAAVAAGFTDNGAPGERPDHHAGYYAAFVLDPAGTNVELVHHG